MERPAFASKLKEMISNDEILIDMIQTGCKLSMETNKNLIT